MKILDPSDREITIGATVVGGGVVVGITEPEGDYNSFGRAVMYGPYVKVMYPEGEERWPCSMPHFGDYETFVCDDVVLT